MFQIYIDNGQKEKQGNEKNKKTEKYQFLDRNDIKQAIFYTFWH